MQFLFCLWALSFLHIAFCLLPDFLELLLCEVSLHEPAAMRLEPFKKLGHYPSGCWIWELWLLCAGVLGTACAHMERNRCHCTTGDSWTQAQRNSGLFSTDAAPQPDTGYGLLYGLVLMSCPPSWHLPWMFLIQQWTQVSHWISGQEMARLLSCHPDPAQWAAQSSVQPLAKEGRMQEEWFPLIK